MRIMSENEICERALRKIGATAIRSAGSRAEEIAEAKYWLDMEIGHIAARKRTWWLVPQTAVFTLTPNVWSYDLNQVLTPQQSLNGIQAVVDIWLATSGVAGPDQYPNIPGWLPVSDDSGVFPEVEPNGLIRLGHVRRQEWESVQVVELPTGTQTGSPRFYYVDRADRPTLKVSPCPDTNGPYTLRVLFQTYSPDFVSAQGNVRLAMLRQTWNLCIVTRLAHQLGNGPIRKLPADEVRDMMAEGNSLLTDLEAYDDEEQAGPGRVSYYDGVC